jgi:hypothetical protein
VPERSPELEQMMRDTVGAMARSELDVIERRTSPDACVLSIGSDASEWAEGFDEIMRLFRDWTPEGEMGVRAGVDDVKAFREAALAGLPTAGGLRSMAAESLCG